MVNRTTKKMFALSVGKVLRQLEQKSDDDRERKWRKEKISQEAKEKNTGNGERWKYVSLLQF